VYEWIVPATRPNRLENPLRKLRLILGDGQNNPMHQEAFAGWVGIPVATLRSIEAGRRPMTKANCLERILITLGAAWNPQDKNWHVLYPESKWLYEKKHERLVPDLDHEDPFVDDLSLHYLINRLLDLFKATTRTQRMGLFLYLNDHLAEIARASKLKVNLDATEPIWVQSDDPNVWGKWLPKPVVWWPRYLRKHGVISPHETDGGVLDFRARRSFNPADYPARTPREVEEMIEAKKRARQQAGTPDNAKNSGTFLAPNGNKSENKAKNRAPKKPADQV
jgi:hypothetical protein